MKARMMTVTAAAALAVGLFVVPGLAESKPSGKKDVYGIDKGHSAINFKVKHLGVAYNYGRFDEFTGSYEMVDGELSSLQAQIKTDSINTNNSKRDGHLKSPDFFNTKQFPELKFTSRKVRKTGTDKYEVTGDLTLLGVTKPITAEINWTGTAADPWGGHRSGFESHFVIKRTDFGMNYGTKAVGEDVHVMASFEGIRQ